MMLFWLSPITTQNLQKPHTTRFENLGLTNLLNLTCPSVCIGLSNSIPHPLVIVLVQALVPPFCSVDCPENINLVYII